MSGYIVCDYDIFTPPEKIEEALKFYYGKLAEDPNPEPRYLQQIKEVEELLEEARRTQAEFRAIDKARELREKGKK